MGVATGQGGAFPPMLRGQGAPLGVHVGLGVGVAVGVPVPVGLPLSVAEGVAEAERVGVGVRVGVQHPRPTSTFRSQRGLADFSGV